MAGIAPRSALDVVADHHRTRVAVELEFAADVIRPADQRAADGQAGELATCPDLAGRDPGPALDVVADHHRARVAVELEPAAGRARSSKQRAADGQAGQ